jgi:hypothetical protein
MKLTTAVVLMIPWISATLVAILVNPFVGTVFAVCAVVATGMLLETDNG